MGYEVAEALGAPLEVWVIRKVELPWHPELGLGAVAEGGFVHISRETVARIGLSDDELSEVVEKKRLEVEQCVRKFRGDRPRPDLQGRTVILVDDGIETGGTALAAIQAIRAEEPKELVLAVPVAAAESIEALAPKVDRIICLLIPSDFYAISFCYEDFRPVSDDEVVRLLEGARDERQGRECVVS